MTKEQAIELASSVAKESGNHQHVVLWNGTYSVVSHPKTNYSIFETVLKVTPRGTVLYPTFNNNGRRVFVSVPA